MKSGSAKCRYSDKYQDYKTRFFTEAATENASNFEEYMFRLRLT